MFTTKHLINDINRVPVTWVFEHYCKLDEKLQGQNVMIKSIFNPTERTPSMSIYLKDEQKEYRFNDFSTGKWGNHIELVKQIYNINYHHACNHIVVTYNDYILHNNGGYDVKEFKQCNRYKVENWKFRSWTTKDEYYWTKFNIGSRLLEEHCVKPLSYYTMVNEQKELKIDGNYIYGYFTKSGDLYKIYQPMTQEKKFLKVRDYLQGSEQLQEEKILVITSSLKDMMSLKSLKLKLDTVAPDSENTLIKRPVIEWLKNKYNHILCLFDNDEAGIKAMEKYQETYNIPPILLTLSKDLSDSVRDYSAKEVRNRLVPLLDRKISLIS